MNRRRLAGSGWSTNKRAGAFIHPFIRLYPLPLCHWSIFLALINGWRLVRLSWLFILLIACQTEMAVPPTTRVLAEGLLNPIGLARLPDGALLVAEMGTGAGDNSAGITFITADRQMGRLVSGIPSTRDSGDLAGAPLVAIAQTAIPFTSATSTPPICGQCLWIRIWICQRWR